jgi:hypothetical protein
MKNNIIIILLFTFGSIFSQEDCKKFKEDYVPKNLNDAIECLNCQWSESDKNEFKNKEEKDAVIELHFGKGMGIRNDWKLWKGKNRLSRFFNAKGISHPDDMSSIILTSFHRKLNNKPINLDEQISYYKDYWERLKNKKKNIKENFKELEKGDIVKVPMSGLFGWRFDGTDRTNLDIYYYTVENSRDFDCIVEGTVVSKYKKRNNFYVEIKLTNLDKCDFKNPIYNEKEIAVGNLMVINMSNSKIIIE